MIEFSTISVSYGCNDNEELMTVASSFFFGVMSSFLRNVAIGRLVIDIRLSTTGVYPGRTNTDVNEGLHLALLQYRILSFRESVKFGLSISVVVLSFS